MAIPESPISSAMVTQAVQALKEAAAASLTAAIVANMKRHVSIEEVLDIQMDVFWALHPHHGHGAYLEWAKTRDERLKKVHA
jgi:hypothetical protein